MVCGNKILHIHQCMAVSKSCFTSFSSAANGIMKCVTSTSPVCNPVDVIKQRSYHSAGTLKDMFGAWTPFESACRF